MKDLKAFPGKSRSQQAPAAKFSHKKGASGASHNVGILVAPRGTEQRLETYIKQSGDHNHYLGQLPHPVMGTTRDHCRHSKALLTPYEGVITIMRMDLSHSTLLRPEPLNFPEPET